MQQDNTTTEYRVDSQWAGFWGGYGAERLLTGAVNARAAEGWRLISTKAERCLWFGLPWIMVFRVKLLYFFERPKTAAGPDAVAELPAEA